MHRTSIVLADDDDNFRSIVRSLLEDDGYQVVAEASDADEACAMARLHRPDAIVLDLVMQGCVCLGTARELLEDDPGCPVVVMSSLFDPLMEREAARIGAWYVEKVEGVEALEHVIDGAIDVSSHR